MFKDIKNLDRKAAGLIVQAKASSIFYGLKYIYVDSFAMALFSCNHNSIISALDIMSDDFEVEELRNHIEKSLDRIEKKTEDADPAIFDVHESVNEMFDLAEIIRSSLGDKLIGINHIFLAMLKILPTLSEYFKKLSITYDEIESALVEMAPKLAPSRRPKELSEPKKRAMPGKSVLALYCKDFTQLAKEGELDKVIGRENEIEYTITVLCRRNKSNPILLGEAGVGKTAVVEGVAQRIVSGKVPERIKNIKIFSLSLSSLVAGTKYRGEFEERMQALIKEVEKDPSIVIFIDEIHTMMGAGSSSGGSMDAANILKPALARKMKIIGATTHDEYKKHIEADTALSRRFEKVFVDEPNREHVLHILKHVKGTYEKFHNCKIPASTLEDVVDYLDRYVPYERFPDKALDCLDTACANYAWSKEFRNIVINKNDIARVISKKSGIPYEVIIGTDIEKIKKVKGHFESHIFGQEHATKDVIDLLRANVSGVRNPNRPVGSLIFGGPSGSGKTYLAEQLAQALFDDRNSIIRVDMSEYKESHSVSKIIGSPPGYVGHADTVTISEKIRRKPYCVLLLDEIEKSHPDVMKLFLQMMGDGFITDTLGNRVNCRNLIIIMTGNFGMNQASKKSLGFGNSVGAGEISSARDRIVEFCKSEYGLEFVNRVDKFVPFLDLTEDSLKKIVESKLNEIASRIHKSNVIMKFSDSLLNYIVEKSKKSYGKNAMMIPRVISSDVEPELIEKLLNAEEGYKTTIKVDVKDGVVKATHSKRKIPSNARPV